MPRKRFELFFEGVDEAVADVEGNGGSIVVPWTDEANSCVDVQQKQQTITFLLRSWATSLHKTAEKLRNETSFAR